MMMMMMLSEQDIPVSQFTNTAPLVGLPKRKERDAPFSCIAEWEAKGKEVVDSQRDRPLLQVDLIPQYLLAIPGLIAVGGHAL
jgi:hypothetical protein